MPETIDKLRPDRDLQCFYYDVSAIAAMSETSPTGFTVSGTWRQQFDWAVVEWNRDNVYEHPAFRTLPDGDLSGLVLTYDETRENCIGIDSDLSPTVAWPYLRIWAGDNGSEEVYFVKLREGATPHAVPVEGAYASAYAEFTLSGSAVEDEYVGLSYPGANFTSLNFVYKVNAGDGLGDIVQAIADGINGASSSLVRAERTGTTIRVYYTSAATITAAETGANGNRFAMFAYSNGSATWDSAGKTFAHGESPAKWRVTLDFSSLMGRTQNPDGSFNAPVEIPTDNIRKMRWTYAAELQADEFARTEFKVAVSNWTVTGSGRGYLIAGPGSRRIENDDPRMTYVGSGWGAIPERGNYSGGSIARTSTYGDEVTVQYRASSTHTLYVGTRYLDSGAKISCTVDSTLAAELDLKIPEEDRLIRWKIGEYGPGTHTVTLQHTWYTGSDFFFDFIELAQPVAELPEFPSMPQMTVATDWDTLHSVSIAPERTAWMIDSMGFHGRQNNYVGALIFYELHNPGNMFASRTVTFSGTPEAGKTVWLRVGPPGGLINMTRGVQHGETLETIALSFAQEYNKGYTAIRAVASGASVTIYSRELGTLGNSIVVDAYSESSMLSVTPNTPVTLAGGTNGEWLTDLTATPRLNRAMRDWTRSFLAALDGYGIDSVCAFSTELKHGDTSVEAGIAQRDSAGHPIELPTPAIQTNFSPTSLDFWKQVHADCAQVMDEAGIVPYLQFGEEQWWYFTDDGMLEPDHVFTSMPFYDAWTMAEFESRYGRPLPVIVANNVNPADYPDEVEFLADVLGEFTDAVMAHVKASYPSARFEVLYPFDVNDTAFNRAINYPDAWWTPAALDCLKTEALRYTFGRNLKASEEGMVMGEALGFDRSKLAHLVGLGDATAAWLKEMRIVAGKGYESAVGFALDQFCLIGYELPFPQSTRRVTRVKG